MTVTRERSRYRDCERALHRALTEAERESDAQVRANLIASCHLQRAWLLYIRKRRQQTDECVQLVFDTLKGYGHLKIRAQALSLRSLLHRHAKRFDLAVEDLSLAAQCWLTEFDLHNLFSVFHNLGCLLSEQAEEEVNHARKRHLREEAVRSCELSFRYCRTYRVGLNSVLPKIQIANLKTKLGDMHAAERYAEEAFSYALSRGNFVEARMAHYHRLKIRLLTKRPNEARSVHIAFLSELNDMSIRDLINTDYFVLRNQSKSGRS